MSIRSKNLLACASLTAITLIFGLVTRSAQTQLGQIAIRLYDDAFMSMSYLRSAQNALLIVSRDVAAGGSDTKRISARLEDAVGECTVAARSGGRFRSNAALVRAYQDGDPEAAAVWLRAVHRLACGIASLVNVLDPEVVLLGGGLARAGSALFDPLARSLDALAWRPLGEATPVLPAALGEFAGAFGAARHAMTQHAATPHAP